MRFKKFRTLKTKRCLSIQVHGKKNSNEKLPDKKCFYSSVKDGTTGDNSEKLHGHISDKDYLTCSKIWNEFNMENMGDYHDQNLKNNILLLADVY